MHVRRVARMAPRSPPHCPPPIRGGEGSRHSSSTPFYAEMLLGCGSWVEHAEAGGAVIGSDIARSPLAPGGIEEQRRIAAQVQWVRGYRCSGSEVTGRREVTRRAGVTHRQYGRATCNRRCPLLGIRTSTLAVASPLTHFWALFPLSGAERRGGGAP
eukprot:1048163-Prorocentrum_minimum.AAC.1